jgi:hypothetical protein
MEWVLAMKCPFEFFLNKRFAWVGLALVSGLALFLLLGTPYYTLWRIHSAAEAGETRKLATYVDFPELRKNIKAQLHGDAGKALQRRSANTDAGAFLGALFSSALADKAVDFLVTPEGLERLLQGRANLNLQLGISGGGSTGSPGQEPTSSGKLSPKNSRSFTWKSMSEFVFSTGEKEKEPVTLVLSRRGWWSWKLTNVLLPVE